MVVRFRPIALMASAVLWLACVRVTEVPETLRDSDAGSIQVAEYDPRRGSDSARVTLVEFGDFQCPYCGDVEPTVKRVLATYPNDVALVFVNLPLSIHANSLRAAQAFLAAARQGGAWQMHDLMFANQQALADAELDQYAQSVGLDVAQFDADRASAEIADEVAQDKALAASWGVDTTPTFATERYWIVGAQPFSVFKHAIDKELAAPVRDAAVDLP